MGKNKNKETEQTCCGGVPLRNGRCPICGDAYANEDEESMAIFADEVEEKASQTQVAMAVMDGCP